MTTRGTLFPCKAASENTPNIFAPTGSRTVFMDELFSPLTNVAEFRMSCAFERDLKHFSNWYRRILIASSTTVSYDALRSQQVIGEKYM